MGGCYDRRMSEDDLVTIRQVQNALEADMLTELLAGEGIVAVTPGATHDHMLGGLLGPALQIPLKVARRDADRARRILDALVEHDGVDEDDLPSRIPNEDDDLGGDGPYRGGPLPEDELWREKKPHIAVAAALIFPFVLGLAGAGHFYARSHAMGLLLLVSYWVCIGALCSGQVIGLVAIPFIIAMDAIGAALAVSQARVAAEARALPRPKAPRRSEASDA